MESIRTFFAKKFTALFGVVWNILNLTGFPAFFPLIRIPVPVKTGRISSIPITINHVMALRSTNI